MRTATVSVDSTAVSPSRALAAVARASAQAGGPLVCVPPRALAELVAEPGIAEAVARRMTTIVTTTASPLAVKLPNGPDRSQTVSVSPTGWSRERLAGWAAGHH